MNYPSKLIEAAVNEISRLPGIGKKSALRLALHLLKKDSEQTRKLAGSLIALREETSYCTNCHNISDSQICGICSSHRRDRSVICVVVDTPDVLAIENTAQFNGLYHVLGGVISPMEGIGPSDLNIDSLIKRVVSAPDEAPDTTAFYLQKKLRDTPVRITTIARGIPVGGDLEYTDEVTLGRSIVGRLLYE
jgi:recombination protein RecR